MKKIVFKKGNVPWNVGKKNSKITREKISKANKGKRPWNYGIPCSDKIKNNISTAVKGENHNRWIGGSRSYYCNVARKVMEKKIGRKLTSTEIVHHLDFNIKNNSKENLYLFKNAKEHSRYHLRLIWIVKKYIFSKKSTEVQ